MQSITRLWEWQALEQESLACQSLDMRKLFLQDAARAQCFSASAAGLKVDYSKNYLTQRIHRKLLQLATVRKMPEQISHLLAGAEINSTEKRPALHTALRCPASETLYYQGENILSPIHACLDKIKNFSAQVREKQWLGYSGKPIQTLVNVGLGGSHLGAALSCEALAAYADPEIKVQFLTETSPEQVDKFLQQLDPQTTGFIIASKSFQTMETIANAQQIKRWLLQYGDPTPHLLAVTAQPTRASAFGITQAHIFPVWDWVGGRYSIWSAMSLATAISIGFKNFSDMLSGGAAMDQHFATAALPDNLPVLLALLEVWYINFYRLPMRAILPYAEALRLLPNYLQQLEMESNGKSVTRANQVVDYATGAAIWGEVGTRGQHSFMQLLHQGTHIIPVDFIIIKPQASQTHATAMQAISQSQALLHGRIDQKNLHRNVPGNRPSNTIVLPDLSPHSLGALLALFEHKVFVKSVIWNINPFDQFGVELGKDLARGLGKAKDIKTTDPLFDSSTRHLLTML